jgi:hypothetical protein
MALPPAHPRRRPAALLAGAAPLGLALAAWLAAGPAAADVLPGVKPECAEGSVPRQDHAGAWCEPTTCDPDQGCGQGNTCRPIKLCIETERYESWRGSNRTELIRKIARGPCEPDGSCVRPAECESTTRCAPGTTGMALPELPKEIPGCAAAPAMPSAPGALVAGSLLAGLAAAWRRRRR